MPTIKKKKVVKPYWAGPQDDGKTGGITQSLLSSFLVCRERFRVKNILGLAPVEEFKPAMDYGNMWHECEEAFAAQEDWRQQLIDCTRKMAAKFPLQKEMIEKWYHVCRTQFPIYIDYWKGDKSYANRTPYLAETCFCVPYTLPSGRIIYLRGKWDSVDSMFKKKKESYWLQENKTKGTIIEDKLTTQLDFDIQIMIYLIALRCHLRQKKEKIPLAGVRYNVIRRPLAGGKHSIRQLKPTKKNPSGESKTEYYSRLGGLIAEEPEHYFMRWDVRVSGKELQDFENRFLIPLLEQLCDWYDHVTSGIDIWGPSYGGGGFIHWQHPYNVYNVLNEGGSTDLDEYLQNGSTIGLQKRECMFPELEE